MTSVNELLNAHTIPDVFNRGVRAGTRPGRGNWEKYTPYRRKERKHRFPMTGEREGEEKSKRDHPTGSIARKAVTMIFNQSSFVKQR